MNKPNLKIVASTIFILALTLGGIFGYSIGTIPSGGPYYLKVPTSTWTYQIGQFSNGSYYMVNSTNWNVDYQSTDGETVLQYAMNNVSIKGGGNVYVKKANYNLSNTLFVPHDTYLVCESGTVFNATSGANLVQTGGYSGDTGISVNCGLIGDGGYVTLQMNGLGTGIRVGNGGSSYPDCENYTIRNVIIKYPMYDGIELYANKTLLENIKVYGHASSFGIEAGYTFNSTFHNIFIDGLSQSGREGIVISGANNVLSDIICVNNYRNGIYCNTLNSTIISNYVSMNNGFGGGWDGLKMRATINCVVEGFVSYNDYDGFKFEAQYPDTIPVFGNLVENNIVSGSIYNWTNAAGYVDMDSQGFKMSNNILTLVCDGDGQSKYGFNIENSNYNATYEAKNNNVTGNTFNLQISNLQRMAFWVDVYNNSWLTDNTFNLQINNCVDSSLGIGLAFDGANNNNSLILRNTFNINVRNCANASYVASLPSKNYWTETSTINYKKFYNCGSFANNATGSTITHDLWTTPTFIMVISSNVTTDGAHTITIRPYAVGTTTFALNCTNEVGTAVTGQSGYWEARYIP